MERNRDEFRKLGLGIAAISYDSVAILHDFAERKGIHYPLLSDPKSEIIRSFGILNESVPTDNPFFGIPYPGSYVVNARGVVTAKYFEDDYKQRYTSADILVRQFGVIPPGAGEVAEGKQLSATATVSNSIVDAGQRVSLVLEIDLKPKMHVYAPSVKGYIPIEWTLKDSEAWVPHEVKFPEAKNLYLKAIDETVPVYAGKLRLTREITLGPDAKLKPALNAAGQLTVEGTLRYQACDDRMCYIPQTLPVKWTFQYEAFDRQRAPAAIQHK